MLLQLLATLCTALFAGAAIYINLVEHPARMSLGAAAALAAAPDLDRLRVLLGRWNSLHGVRSLLSLTALVIFLIALAGNDS